jgi:S-adenosylmethionine hydrolase
VIEIGDRALIGPDNGFASDVLVTRAPARFFVIDDAATHAATGSRARGSTFHGRDVFAPVAAAIARGARALDLGVESDRAVMLRDVPSASIDGRRVTGVGRHVDRFGNILSDIPGALLRQVFGPDLAAVRVRAGDVDAGGLRDTYAEGEAGVLIALLNSWDLVEVAIREGRACDVLGAANPRDVRFELFEP